MSHIFKLHYTILLLPLLGGAFAQTAPISQSADAVHVARVVITGVRIAGNHTLTRTQLWQAIERSGNANIARLAPSQLDKTKTEVTFDDLQAVADAITQAYRAAGYFLATAFVEGETNGGSIKLHEGAATIVVLEGSLDKILVTGATRYPENHLKHYIEEALCDGKIANCHGINITQSGFERSARILGDLPGVAVDNRKLSPGSFLGSSDYNISLTSLPVFSGEVTADNFGNRYLGKNHLSANMLLSNPSGRGEQYGAGITSAGRESNSGYFDASLPVGYSGLRVGVGYNHSLYNLGEPFDAVNARGKANIGKLYAQYPLIRSNSNNLSLKLSYGFKSITDEVLDLSFRKKAQIVQLSVDGNVMDALLGGGMTSYGAGLSVGTVSRFGGENAPSALETSGSFSKLSYQLSRNQIVVRTANDTRTNFTAFLRGQFASTNLDASEKFSLGGPDGVRAYPSGEAVGDQGAVFSLALHHARGFSIFGQTDITLSAFVDAGWIETNRSPIPNDLGPTHRQLLGYGLEASILRSQRYQFRLTWARRDGGSDPATSDEDSRNRFWAQLLLPF